MDFNIAKSSLEEFVSKANEIIQFKLIRKVEDLDDDSIVFYPEYSHQFFGDSENIFGYKNLKIKLYYTARKLKVFYNESFNEKLTPDKCEGLEADNVLKIIKDKLEIREIFTNIDTFIKSLSNENNFKPYGEKLFEFNSNDNNIYEIYYANLNTPNFIQNYHEQMQHFLLWFIDGASYIDIDDDHWDYFVVYEKVNEPVSTQYYFVGYLTAYKYYAYPENIRPRISQVLILPPFQKKNIGVNLLKTVYNYYIFNPKVTDITVEDPSDNFCQLKNYVDCLYCQDLKSYSVENLKKGWCKEMEDEAKKVYKIHKYQARKVYEILKLMNTNTINSEEYKNYRLEVKRRLSAPLMKNKKTTKFFGQKPNLNFTPKEVIIEQLTIAYNELEKEYLKTITRLKNEN